jgi:6-phosphogluconolactonase
MKYKEWREERVLFNEKWDVAIPGDRKETIQYCVDQFLELAQESMEDHGNFSVALSGGSTPKAIFQELALPKNSKNVDWKKVLLFWGDERSVSPHDSESNFHMAMESGFSKLPIEAKNIFRMKAESDIEENAREYENIFIEKVASKSFDLIMLGMGEDGHTASLFPKTHGLHSVDRLVIANYVPQKNTWRMSLTYECINNAKNISIYVLGESKAAIVEKIFLAEYQPDEFPIQGIGTSLRKALWILDKDAAQDLVKHGTIKNKC